MWSFYRLWISAWAIGGAVAGVVAGVIVAALVVLLKEGMVEGPAAWFAIVLAVMAGVMVLLGTPAVLLWNNWNNWDDPFSGNSHEQYVKGLLETKDVSRKVTEGGLAVSVVVLGYASAIGLTYYIGQTAYARVEQAQIGREAKINAEVRQAKELIELEAFHAAVKVCEEDPQAQVERVREAARNVVEGLTGSTETEAVRGSASAEGGIRQEKIDVRAILRRMNEQKEATYRNEAEAADGVFAPTPGSNAGAAR